MFPTPSRSSFPVAYEGLGYIGRDYEDELTDIACAAIEAGLPFGFRRAQNVTNVMNHYAWLEEIVSEKVKPVLERNRSSGPKVSIWGIRHEFYELGVR